jgi:hypothetical protein
MDEKGQMIGFRVTAKEREQLDAEAAQSGVSLTDYIRRKVLATEEVPPRANLERLLRHVIYMASRIHIAVYAMHEMAGTLSKDELKKIYEGTRPASAKYLAELSDELTSTEARIAEQVGSAAARADDAEGDIGVQEARQ